MPLISIIIPVYNAERFLIRAVKSVQKQTFEDWEILLINDGSTDSSRQMCDDLAKEDFRIRVFHKQNGGVASARNVGLRKALGRYIGFMDNDDYILPDMYEKLYEASINSGADVVSCGYYIVSKESFIEPLPQNEESIKEYIYKQTLTEGVIDGRTFFSNTILGTQGNTIWKLLIKKEFLKDVTFSEEKKDDDVFLTIYIAEHANMIYLVSGSYYIWIHREDSQTFENPELLLPSAFQIRCMQLEHSKTSNLPRCAGKSFINAAAVLDEEFKKLYKNRPEIKNELCEQRNFLKKEIKYLWEYDDISGSEKATYYLMLFCPIVYFTMIKVNALWKMCRLKLGRIYNNLR